MLAVDSSSFWQWFMRCEHHLRSLPVDQLVDALHEQLVRVSPRPGIECAAEGELREVIVTAHGDRQQFGFIRGFVRAAPAVQSWRFVALKPGTGFDFVTRSGAHEIDSAELRFDPLYAGERLRVRVYVPPGTPIDEDLNGLLFMMIATGLGEELAASVDCIEAVRSSGDDQGLAIHQLAEYISWYDRAVRGLT